MHDCRQLSIEEVSDPVGMIDFQEVGSYSLRSYVSSPCVKLFPGGAKAGNVTHGWRSTVFLLTNEVICMESVM